MTEKSHLLDDVITSTHEVEYGTSHEESTEKKSDLQAPLHLPQVPPEGIMRTVLTMLLTRRNIKVVVVLIFMLVSLYFFTSAATQTNTEELRENADDEIEAAEISIMESYPYSYHIENDPKALFSVKISVQKIRPELNQTILVELVGISGGNSSVLDYFLLEAPVAEKLEHEQTLTLSSQNKNSYDDFYIWVKTASSLPFSVNVLIIQMPSYAAAEILFAAIILGGVYVFIIFEVFHRTIVAMLGAFIALAILSTLRERPSFERVISWIDFETVGLLFGMMLMVGIFAKSGFFEFAAVKACKFTKGNIWMLVVILCFFTGIVSAFLDNVTTVLLLTPVVIRLCRVLNVDPVPILLSIVFFSNIGGTATAIGDPPNIIIVNNPDIKATDLITFSSFAIHMVPGVFVSFFIVLAYVKYMYGKEFSHRTVDPKVKEIEIWKRTLSRMRDDTDDEKKVKEKLGIFIKSLEVEAGVETTPALTEPSSSIQMKEIEEGSKATTSPPTSANGALDIGALEEQYKIKDMTLCINSALVLSGVVIMFFLRSGIHLNLTLAWIAIIGAMILLMVSGIKEIDEVLEKVEWGTLLFFAALFVLMKGLDELGLVEFIGDQTKNVISQVPEGKGRLAASIFIIIWVSACCSAFIDNIPYTTTMVPVVVKLTTSGLGLPLAPLVWALAYGTCFGGNATLIGASANVVVAGIAEGQGFPISFNTFFKMGAPVTVMCLLAVTAYLMLVHVVFEWH